MIFSRIFLTVFNFIYCPILKLKLSIKNFLILPFTFLKGTLMGNNFIPKSLNNAYSKLLKSLRSFDMNEEKFWLMNHVPVVIAMDFKTV